MKETDRVPQSWNSANSGPPAYVGNSAPNLIDSMGLCPNQLCVTGALEEVIKTAEGTNGPDGYGLLANGTVMDAPSQFSSLIGQRGTKKNPIVIDPGGLTSFPNIKVQVQPGLITHAFGAYQFMPGTWKFFGGGSDVSPSAQDDVAAAMLNYYDAVQPAMAGNLQQAFWNMFQWASMPDAPNNQPHISMDRATSIYNDALSYLPECQ